MKITIDTDVLHKENFSFGDFLVLLIGYYDISYQKKLYQRISEAAMYRQYTYAALLVQGCCTFLVPFFQFVYRQYSKSKLELKVKSLELFSLRCDSLIIHRLQVDNSKFEFYPHTLTLTLTTETPINRASQQDCEGVRVRKEKSFFYPHTKIRLQSPLSC